MEIHYDIDSKPGDEQTKRCQRILLGMARNEYAMASKARETGPDFEPFVESPPATSIAERTENIVGPKGVAVKFSEVMKKNNDNLMKSILEVIDLIISGELGGIQEKQKRVEQALRTALALYTQAVTVSPIEGLTDVFVKKNTDETEYIELPSAGPIRSAGGTGAALPILWADYIRKKLGLDVFKIKKEEIERYAEEVEKYSEIYTRQAKFTTDDVRWVMSHCPIALNGNATEDVEVSENRDLERVETNALRGGCLLVIEEGLLLKAPKLYKFAKEMGLDWDWLEKVLKVKKSTETEKVELKPVYGYLTGGLAAGRPIFSYPMRRGGFRLQYGRARNTGIAAKGVHPATMRILDDFASIGMQLKMERPGKATCITPCDSIEGPIVKLANGDVVKVRTEEHALEVRSQVRQILFLGDLLVSYGDFRKTGENLAPVGYNELWWKKEVERAAMEKGVKEVTGVNLAKALENPRDVTGDEAVTISLQLNVPLHPEYVHYYDSLNKGKIARIITALKDSDVLFEGEKIESITVSDLGVKETLEDIGLEHRLRNNKIVIGKRHAYPLMKTFGLVLSVNPLEALEGIDLENPLEILSRLSGITIRDKSGLFIGGRLGRPEAESLRTMKGSPQCLFPVGRKGGNTRNLMKAIEDGDGVIEVEASSFSCGNCKSTGISVLCEECGKRRAQKRWCENCQRDELGEECPKCKQKTRGFFRQKMDARKIVMDALKRLGEKAPKSVKGVIALWSDDRIPEPIEKGILRAKHGIFIYQDGLSRYEMLNLPLTHAKLKEISLTPEKARGLGYEKDYKGKPLESIEQTIELFIQDIIVNEGEESGEKEGSGCAEYFVKLSQFLDEELVKVYGMQPYYNVKAKQDLIGKLVIGLAPHTSAAAVGRIIGFSKARAHYAHPYFHMAKRRNCDGEQDSYTLLLDLLLNFSKKYLPSRRGGKMDAALVTTVIIDPAEIDDEVYEMEAVNEYPLELFEAAKEHEMPFSVKIPIVKERIGKDNQYAGLGFTHDVSDMNAGPKRSAYTTLKSMSDKVEMQLDLQDKIRAVDRVDAAEKVVSSHLVRDIMGNMRSFALQKFRCSTCSEIYRRMPLSGRCPKCNGNIILTISKGTVEKYLKLSQKLVQRYPVKAYLKQRIQLLSEEVNSCFKGEKEEKRQKSQKSLAEFV